MAYVQNALPTRNETARADNYPYLLGFNASRLRYEDTTYEHRWNTTGTFANPDLSVADYELYICAGDNTEHIQSYPAGTSATWYALFAFEAPGIDVDTVALLNCDFASETVTIDVQISNVSTFASLLLLDQVVMAPGDRLIIPHDDDYYSGVEYLRLVITTAFHSTSNFIPKIGEVYIGKRRQLFANPRAGFDHQNLRTVRDFGRTRHGAVSTYAYRKGVRHINASIPHFRDDDVSDIITLYEIDTRHGSEPLLWVDNSASDSDVNFSMMHPDNPDLVSTYAGPHDRRFETNLTECGPTYLAQNQTWHI